MILALKTAGNTSELYLLYADGQSFAHESWESGRALADELLGRIESFIEEQKLDFSGLTGLVIFSGPGSFTSLRIGHTVMNALADSLAVPVVGTMGDDWLPQGLKDLNSAQPRRPALPHYGADANVTLPKP